MLATTQLKMTLPQDCFPCTVTFTRAPFQRATSAPADSSSSGPLSRHCKKGKKGEKPICSVSARQACQISMMPGQRVQWQNHPVGQQEENQLPSKAVCPGDGLKVSNTSQRELQWPSPGRRLSKRGKRSPGALTSLTTPLTSCSPFPASPSSFFLACRLSACTSVLILPGFLQKPEWGV